MTKVYIAVKFYSENIVFVDRRKIDLFMMRTHTNYVCGYNYIPQKFTVLNK